MKFDYKSVPEGHWIGVDVDGTLARYDTWEGPQHIGEPITPMVELVKELVKNGIEVRLFTARVGPSKDNMNECRYAIELWCERNLGFSLPVTHAKDYLLYAFFDDRAIQVYPNTGASVEEELEAMRASRDYWKSQLPEYAQDMLNDRDPYNLGTV